MSDLINVFTKLSEFYHPTLSWEEIEAIYLKIEEEKANSNEQEAKKAAPKPTPASGSSRHKKQQRCSSPESGIEDDDTITKKSPLSRIPIVAQAENDSSILSVLLELATTIRSMRESSGSYDNTFDCWDQVIKVSPRSRYLAFIYALVGLGNQDPRNRRYRQLSLAASSVYLLSLTIAGAKGFHIFEEELISVSLQVFNMVEKIQSPAVSRYVSHQHSIETWVNFTAFCDDLKLMFRFVHFDEYKTARNAIVRKLIDMQYLCYEKGFVNMYAANLHGKYFEILDEVVSAHNGDPKETLLKIMNMTLFLHAYNSKPKGGSASTSSNVQTDGCEHISDWFIKIIGKFPRIVSEVLEFYIQCVITNPEKGWKTEHIQRALDYAAKYDAALFTRCNASIVDFLSEAVYAEEVSIRSRAVDLFSKIILLESNVDWELFRHKVSETPREVYIIKELVDSIRDTNNSIKIKAIQALQQALIKGSPNTKKILNEGIKYAQVNDFDVQLPEEPKVLENEIRYAKPKAPDPAYTFTGSEILIVSFLHLHEQIYPLFSNPVSHLRRAAVMFLETIVKINPLIIFNTNFVKETCQLVNEPTLLVRKQTMIMVDSILETYPNCYPVIFVWCKILTPMLQDGDPKNIELAMECFRKRVLLNIKGIDQTNKAEHFMPWVIIRTLLITQSRMYLQYSFHMALKMQMINQQIISTIESHILASNSTEAWILLNFICGKIKSKEPDSLIHCFISYHSSKEWNNEQNLLIALEVLNTCAKDFSYPALNNVFKHLIQSIKSGMIIPQVIGKAFDFLSTINHRSRANQIRSTPPQQIHDDPSHEWIIELHKYLEQKLLDEMSNFPENRSIYMSHLFSYSEANLEIKQRPHPTIVSFIQKYILACVNLPEAELETDNDRIFNSMILISGRFSIRDSIVANTTCKLYGKILKAIDRPPIVNTILVAVADLCKKHTQIVETILDRILEKLSSKYLINRLETFKSFAALVLQDQLKLRGSLLLAMLGLILDDNQDLSDRAVAFFTEFISSKNPGLFHKCLIECPFVLNEYPNFEGLDTFSENMIKSPLKGEDKRKVRHKLYDHFMQSIDDVHLIMYFSNLKLIAEKSQNDPLIKSDEGTALVNDIIYILKRICQKERKEVEHQQTEDGNDELADASENPSAETVQSASNSVQVPGKRGKRRHVVTMADALTTLEKSIVHVITISEALGSQNDSIRKSIDELAKELAHQFPNIIDFAQPAEFWNKYRKSIKTTTSTPKKRKLSAEEDDLDGIDFDDDPFDQDGIDNNLSSTPINSSSKQKCSDTLEYMLLA
ncbi:condensin-2 complex subunit D3 [Eupeodes corollae]|uniref:condensin-2 complex subunit D3 n=1 Tax=Eupeodes corollae TaxID=290404 RepID=UPI00248FBB72|nr:condensin-2 complex subunit D3 [Eupeodes corollae]